MSGLQRRRPPVEEEIQPVDDEEPKPESAGEEDKGADPPTALPRRHRRKRLPKAEAAGLLTAVLVVLAVRFLLLPGGTPQGTPLPGGGVLLTPAQLARYDGKRGRRLYLAIMGEVYDVTAGARFYGPGGSYGGFGGRDASRSYVTGKFKADLHDDVADFTGEQHQELGRWRAFYRDHKVYKYVGRVVGRFYDAAGGPTALLLGSEAAARAAARAAEAAEAAQGQQQAPADPACDVKWSQEDGGWVSCIDGRVPRRVRQPDWQGRMQERCVCVEGGGAAAGPDRRLYDGCSPEAAACRTSQPERPAGRGGSAR